MKNGGCFRSLVKWVFIIGALLYFLAFVANSCGQKNKSNYSSEYTTAYTTGGYGDYTTSAQTAVTAGYTEQTTELHKETFDEEDAQLSVRYKYWQLDDVEKDIYEHCYDAVSNGTNEVVIKNLEYEEYNLYLDKLETALYSFVDDYPEFFWLRNGYQANYNYFGKQMEFTITCWNFWTYSINKDKYLDAFNEKLKDIVAQAEQYSTDYDKVKFVHDYFVQRITYDDAAAADDNRTSVSSQQSSSAYGALVNDSCVCAGYAKAFQLVMQNLGFECGYVRGDAGGYHAWNIIPLGGEYYYFDLTWDDAGEYTYSDDTYLNEDGVIYDYFAITTKELRKTHDPNREIYSPICTATEYNYFHKEGYYLEDYSYDAAEDIIADQIDKPIISIKFSSLEEAEEARSKLMRENEYDQILDSCGYYSGSLSYCYYFDEDFYIIKVCQKI